MSKPLPSIVYATSSGGTTIDADQFGGNPFATSLIELTQKPGVGLCDLLPQVRDLTYIQSGRHQRPCWKLQATEESFAFPYALGSRSERRVALVLIVSDYKNTPVRSLEGAAQDERRIASMLASHGFTVTQGVKGDKASLLSALRVFAKTSREADVAVIYSTGHGVEHKGNVHLLPATYPFEIDDKSEALRAEAISIDRMAASCESRKGNVLFFAGCRSHV